MGNPREGSSPFARTIFCSLVPLRADCEHARVLARVPKGVVLAIPGILKKYNEISLIKRILVGLIIGVILALDRKSVV